jgi:hypothetical protein
MPGVLLAIANDLDNIIDRARKNGNLRGEAIGARVGRVSDQVYSPMEPPDFAKQRDEIGLQRFRRPMRDAIGHGVGCRLALEPADARRVRREELSNQSNHLVSPLNDQRMFSTSISQTSRPLPCSIALAV